jgi:DNA-binding Lrp family transcriptional regulator
MEMLSADGRVSNREIATQLSLSEAFVASRIRSLIAANVMRVVLQRSTIGIGPNAVPALIEFYIPDPAIIGDVAGIIAAQPAIFAAYETARRPEIVAQCIAPSRSDLNRLVLTLAELLPEVVGITTLPILELGQTGTEIGVVGKRMAVPRADHDVREKLIELLSEDGRQPISSLARQLGLSPTAARYRLNRLLSEPGMRIGIVYDAPALGLTAWADIRLQVAPHSIPTTIESLARLSALRVIAHISGSQNIALFVVVTTIEELDEFINKYIRTIPMLKDFTVLRVPKIIKYDYNYIL